MQQYQMALGLQNVCGGVLIWLSYWSCSNGMVPATSQQLQHPALLKAHCPMILYG